MNNRTLLEIERDFDEGMYERDFDEGMYASLDLYLQMGQVV